MKAQSLLLLVALFVCMFTYGQTGPGGVGDASSNSLWLRADDITGVTPGNPLTVTWADASGNGNDASQSTASYRPTFETSGGISFVRFDGVDDFLDDAHSYTARTVFCVYRVSSTLQAGGDLAQLWGNYPEGVQVAPDPRSGGNVQGFSFDGQTSSGTTAKYALNGDAYTSFNANSNTQPFTYNEYEIIATEFNSDKALTRQVIGSLYPSFTIGQHQFGGDIAEIIVFNTVLNDAQRIIVENYLSASYGINLTANDYFSYQGSHPHELVGVGRVDVSNTHTEATASGLLTLTTGAGLDTDGEYLLMAHNNDGIASWSSTDAPTGFERIAREWRVDETGELGDVTITLDSSLLSARSAGYSIFMLLTDADGNFSSGATYTTLESAGGSLFEADIDLTDGDYITIAAFKPEVQFVTTASANSEDIGNDTLMVELNRALDDDVDVDYAVTGGDATGSGTDFTLAAGTVTILAGDTTAMIIFSVVDDATQESTETIEVTLSNPVGASLGTNTVHTYSINDNDAPRNIEFAVRSADGAESVNTVNVAVRLDVVDPSNPTSADYSVTGGDATGSGTDYTLSAGTATIPAGDTSVSFTINIHDDALDEVDEKIILTLSNPVNGNIGSNNTYTYKINDNDAAPTVALTSASSSGSESTSPVNLTVQLSAVSGKDVTVNYGLGAGTATNGVDFSLAGSSIVIPAGNNTGIIPIYITDDSSEEPEETVIINLTGATNATVSGISTYTHTILESDGIGTGGPAGVGDMSTNPLWLKADNIIGLSDGAAISGNWPDASGNSYNASQITTAYRPTYQATAANGKPAVRFDGVDDYLDNNRSYTAQSVFVVFRVSSAAQDNADLAQLWGAYDEGVQVSVDPRGTNTRGYSFDGDNSVSNTARYALDGNSFTGSYHSNNNSVQWTYDQWHILTVEFNAARSVTRQVIGSLVPSQAVGNHMLGGDIAEIIVYSDTLGVTRRSIIQNYLAAKYDIAISNDLYSWQSTHGDGMIGIGSEDGILNHVYAEDGAILSIGSASSLNSGDYLFIGHNGSDIDSFSTVGLPSIPGVSRVAREWRVDETGDIGTIDFSIDTTSLPAKPAGENNYLLFVDDDGDYTTGGTAIYRLTENAGKYTVSGIDLNDGDYLTIATASNVSTASGNFNTAGNWASGSVPATGEAAVIAQGQTLTLSSVTTVGSVFLSANATLELDSYELEIDEGDFIAAGDFDAGTGTVSYVSDNDQLIAAVDYNQLDLDGLGTKTLTGAIEVGGNLNIAQGTLDVSAVGNYQITVGAEWKLDGGSFEPRNGTVTFAGGSLQNITTNGSAFYDVELNNAAGFELQDEMEVEDIITFTDGVLTTGANRLYISNTNGNAVQGASSSSFVNGNLRRAIAANTDTYRMPVGNGTATSNYHYADIMNNNLGGVSYLDASFIPLANHDDLDIAIDENGFVVNTVNTAGVWLVEPDQQPSGGNYGFIGSLSNFSGLTDNEFLIVKRPSGSTTAADWSTGGGRYNPDNGYGRMLADGEAMVLGLTSFSQFGMGGGSGGALPIELLYFHATVTDNNTIALNWATEVEINNEYFTIERSADGSKFEELFTVEGAINSTVTLFYSEEDTDPLTGVSYYRLKQTDIDGKFEHSDIVSVSLKSEQATSFNIYPNPVTGHELTIDLGAASFTLNNSAATANIKIINMLGEIVHQQQVSGSGKTPITLPANMSKGTYLLQLNKNGDSTNQPFLYR